MSACTDPTKPWFGIDFLTWTPPPLEPLYLECDGCGHFIDEVGAYSVILIPVFCTTGPMIVCPTCRDRSPRTLSAWFEITIALRMGKKP